MDIANHLLPGRYAFVRADRDLGDLYRSMDALCLVSETEGFGLVMLEAMLCGVPVIAGRIGFAPEKLTHRVSGVLVDGDPPSIAKAARLLAKHPRWAAAVAQEGRRLAEQFGYAARMGREYEDLLHRLWAAKHGPAREAAPTQSAIQKTVGDASGPWRHIFE
jgi:glycosyltransferase involved in cell wall biosynthesis